MRRNTEGNVYKVGWRKAAAGYTAWLKQVPKLKVKGGSEEELSELLFEIAMDRFGDGEPCFDFDPPLPAESPTKGYFEPEWFSLGSNEGFRTVGDRAPLFEEGLCGYCGAGCGKRTSVPRVLDWVPKSDFAFVWSERPYAYIVTEKFLDFFGPLLGRRMRTIPCTPGGKATKAKKIFFELDLTPDVPLAVHKEATQVLGIVCPSCKREYLASFVCHAIAKGLFDGVERDKLTGFDRGILIAAGGLSRSIFVDAALAKRMKAKSGLKGVLLHRLVMLEAVQVGKYKLAKAGRVGK